MLRLSVLRMMFALAHKPPGGGNKIVQAAGRQVESEVPHERGQHEGCFLQRERRSEAHTPADAEGKIGLPLDCACRPGKET
jgi:hypothetical protein